MNWLRGTRGSVWERPQDAHASSHTPQQGLWRGNSSAQFIYLKKHLFSWLGLMNFSWFTLSWGNHLAVIVCAGCLIFGSVLGPSFPWSNTELISLCTTAPQIRDWPAWDLLWIAYRICLTVRRKPCSMPGTLLSASVNEAGSACYFDSRGSWVPRRKLERHPAWPWWSWNPCTEEISMAGKARCNEDTLVCPGLSPWSKCEKSFILPPESLWGERPQTTSGLLWEHKEDQAPGWLTASSSVHH